MKNSKRNALYRFYSATGQLLYVGITSSPDHRVKQHQRDKPWWAEVAGISIETFPSREEVEAAERRAILVEHPRYNVQRPAPRPRDADTTLPPRDLAQATRLPWRCRHCGREIAANDGGVWIDIAECNQAELEQRTWQESHSNRAISLEELLQQPEDVRWQISHNDCGPDLSERVIYHIDISELPDYAALLGWTAHLAGKRWLEQTDWMQLMERAASGMLWKEQQ